MKREITDEQYLELKGWGQKYHGIYSDPLTKIEWNVISAVEIQERREKEGFCYDEIMFLGDQINKLRISSWDIERELLRMKKKWYHFWK